MIKSRLYKVAKHLFQVITVDCNLACLKIINVLYLYTLMKMNAAHRMMHFLSEAHKPEFETPGSCPCYVQCNVMCCKSG